MTLTPQLHASLVSIYEEIMWLARRPNVTPGRARAWYTHIMAEAVKRQIRRFTGEVSASALASTTEPLMLEHFKRIQTTLSALVQSHREANLSNAEEFVQILIDYEQVHIVTRSENYAALRAKGDYDAAGIKLIAWASLPAERQQVLWRTMLRGKVANAHEYSPPTEA